MHIYKDIRVHKIMDTQNKGWPYFPLGLLFLPTLLNCTSQIRKNNLIKAASSTERALAPGGPRKTVNSG